MLVEAGTELVEKVTISFPVNVRSALVHILSSVFETTLQ